MRDDQAIVALVLLAIATVLFAPLAGRSGWPGLATTSMLVAAGSGVAAFVLAVVATVRAGRRPPRAGRGPEEP
ncbi:MAG: hypothetical protein OZ948_08495 [Deltaproteobacteria bacterium]|nr:hypothetical protein [Deltaproteobacteria bacterium]